MAVALYPWTVQFMLPRTESASSIILTICNQQFNNIFRKLNWSVLSAERYDRGWTTAVDRRPLPVWQTGLPSSHVRGHGTWLAWRAWNLSQQRQELPCLDKRGGSHARHLDGERRRHALGVWSLLSWTQWGWTTHQAPGTWIYVEPTSGIHLDLPIQPWNRS